MTYGNMLVRLYTKLYSQNLALSVTLHPNPNPDPSPAMPIRINQKVTRINIEIRDNSGKVVSLDDNNTIILRLELAI